MDIERDLLTMRIPEQDSFGTSQEARKAGAWGWNRVCCRCGRWGAVWYTVSDPYARRALCSPHAAEARDQLVVMVEARVRLMEMLEIIHHQPAT